MRVLILFCLAASLSACGQKAPDACNDNTLVSSGKADPKKPNILVIGDSISIYWAPYAAAQLPQYNVYHTYCNSEGTTNLLAHLSSYLTYAGKSWDLVIFDAGDWDIPPNADGISVSEYQANLTVIGSEIKAHAAHTLFLTEPMVSASFTPVQLGPDEFTLSNATITTYNEAAQSVMEGLGIPVLDLFSVSQPLFEANDYDSSGIHFNQAGDQFLGAAVASQVQEMMQ
jgi:lysophospholipase L1-like esterase